MTRGGQAGRDGTWRVAGFVASALLHAVLLACLLHYAARDMPAYDQPPPLQVVLITPSRLDRDRETPRPVRRRVVARTSDALSIPPGSSLSSMSNITPSRPNGTAVADVGLEGAAPEAAAQGAGGLAASGREALRGLGGCNRPTFSRQERERCEAERWAGVAPATARLNLDPSGRFAKDPTPYLVRRPEKGCRLRMTGEADARGDDQNVRAGVTCVKRF